MTKVMWLGEDAEGYIGPSHIIWNGVRLPKDVAVEVADEDQLRRARKCTSHFKVIEEMKQEDSHGESQTQGEEKDKKEDKEKGYDYREKEKGSGYSPVKKKVRKKKPASEPASDRVSTPDP